MTTITQYKQSLAQRDSATAGVCLFGWIPSKAGRVNPEWRPAS